MEQDDKGIKLKYAVQDKTGRSPETIKLVCGGRFSQDELTL
jgi:hypothetical protein